MGFRVVQGFKGNVGLVVFRGHRTTRVYWQISGNVGLTGFAVLVSRFSIKPVFPSPNTLRKP